MELEKCPFCGYEVEYHHYEMSGEHHFECKKCGALVLLPVNLTKDEAITFWNRRWFIYKSGCDIPQSDFLMLEVKSEGNFNNKWQKFYPHQIKRASKDENTVYILMDNGRYFIGQLSTIRVANFDEEVSGTFETMKPFIVINLGWGW